MHHSSPHLQDGFTLIELMMVVAIIAILAAIAIPQYNDYTARTQLTEAYSLASGGKAAIVDGFSNNLVGTESCVLPDNLIVSGKYVASLEATPNAACQLTATMKNSGVNTKVSGKKVVLSYTPLTGVWACATDAPIEIRPKACSSSI